MPDSHRHGIILFYGLGPRMNCRCFGSILRYQIRRQRSQREPRDINAIRVGSFSLSMCFSLFQVGCTSASWASCALCWEYGPIRESRLCSWTPVTAGHRKVLVTLDICLTKAHRFRNYIVYKLIDGFIIAVHRHLYRVLQILKVHPTDYARN